MSIPTCVQNSNSANLLLQKWMEGVVQQKQWTRLTTVRSWFMYHWVFVTLARANSSQSNQRTALSLQKTHLTRTITLIYISALNMPECFFHHDLFIWWKCQQQKSLAILEKFKIKSLICPLVQICTKIEFSFLAHESFFHQVSPFHQGN